jgi:tetratricopeptide (TPR) repeat protein
MAECYSHLGDPDGQLAALRRACTADPQNPLLLSRLAAALFALGRYDEALDHYQRLVSPPHSVVGGWTMIARIQLLRTLLLPPDKRNWDPVSQALRVASEANPGGVEVPILVADARAAQGEMTEARKLLEETCDKYPKMVEPWLALAALADREGKPKEAQRVLNEAEKKLGQGVDLLLARLRLVRMEKDLPMAQSLEKAAASLKSGTADQIRLCEGLAGAYSRLGKDAEVQRIWQRSAELQPHDLSIRMRLFDLALKAEDLTTLERVLRDIERIEGPGGPIVSFGRACRLIRMAKQDPSGSKDALVQARAQLTRVAAKRPGWARVAAVLGEIDELEHNPDKAVEDYQRAIELGERQPSLVRRVAELLYERQRYAEADQAIRKLLEQQASLPQELQLLASETSLRTQNLEQALKFAKEAAKDSKKFGEHIWLGRLLWAADKKADAKKPLSRAVELANGAPEPWVALIQYYKELGRTDKVEATIQDVQKKLAKDAAPFVLAQCYESIARRDKAEEQYRAALAARPDDPIVLQSVASFYLRAGQPEKAIPHLRTLLKPRLKLDDKDKSWSRRSLAVALAVGGDHQRVAEALALVEEDIAQFGESSEDLYTKARVLAAEPYRRKEAIEILEKQREMRTLTADQSFTLGVLYETQDNWPRARQLILQAVSADGANPLYLMTYVNGLLVNANSLLVKTPDTSKLLADAELAEAEVWMRKLELLKPVASQTIALEARLLALQGKSKEAIDVVNKYADNKSAELQDTGLRLRFAATVLDGLGQAQLAPGTSVNAVAARLYNDAAEEMYRKAIEQSASPENLLALAGYLGRQQRLAKAIDLCERAWVSGQPETVATVSVGLLRGAPAGDPSFDHVERQLQAALEKNPKSLQLRLMVARLRELRGRYAEAETLYRKMLADNRHFIPLNELAYLLALQGDSKVSEGLRLIQEAIALAGPMPALLDTRAVCYLASGQDHDALEDLKKAVADGSSPTRYFHLALAYQRLNQRDDARSELEKAKVAGLKVHHLHPLEQSSAHKLIQELASP